MKSKSNQYEKIVWQEFHPAPIIGVDEVGRGCLAGPVYAAAVILDIKNNNSTPNFPILNLDELTDSKLLSEKRRNELSALIKNQHTVSIGFATVEEIDQLNILQASLLAMKRAVLGLKVNSGHVLVDGNFKIPNLVGYHQTTFVKGDLRVAPISAASIVAKVTRDELMNELAEKNPGYGFEVHKGYATKFHSEKIQEFGPCSQHRRTFKGVKEYLT